VADGSLPIVVTPEAFGRDAFDLTVVEGLTVRAMLVEAVKAGLPIEALNRTEIYVDGARLDRETALDHVLAADQVVNVVVEPMGGGGGGRKDIGQILLTVAVIAVSAWVGGGAGGMITSKLLARAAAAAITLGGQALIASLYAPDNKATKANDRYALQSASNQYRQWGPMPLALGEVVVAPDLAAKTFTQSQGDDVWMYGVLGVHYGPCEVSEVKIGDTLVSTMGAGDFRMVQHLEPGPRTFQLYPNDVDQLDLNEELKATPSSATPLVRAASSDGSRFDLDFFLPAGLYFQKDDGRVLTAHASVAVRYRPIDQTGVATGPWQSAPSWARTSATKDPIRVTHSVHLPHGRYEFELTRNRPDDGNDKRRDTIMVSAIKSVAFRKPVADETLSIIEFAVRATAINQGGLAPITCRIKPKCSTWTGGAWGPPVATSNPAALARWLLTGPAPAKPLLPAQADARLRVWHQLCEQYDWKCHFYLTEARTQSEALAILERAGRAGVFWDGTQLAASPWVEKPIPAQVFTDDNLKDHRWEIVYPDPVHALRVEFQNIEKGGEPDELFVYNDGYGEVADPANGIKAASLIEALTLDGQATPNRAYRDGRWKLGQRRHQRRIDTWTADVEHLISHYGSRVRLAWNRAGGGSARVRCRRWSEDGSAVVGLRLSAPVEMFAGVSYAVDLRTKGGLYDGVPIQTQPGVTREILFASARAPSVCPAAGDLIAFGEVEKVSEDVEIIAIEPGENLTAVLTGVRYVAPLLMAGETGPIPPLTSKLSGDRQANPPRPTLLGVTADAHAVRVSFDMPTWRGAPLSGFSVRWRAKGEEGEAGSWAPLPALDAAARELIAPPLREAPVEGVEATRVEIEITAATVDGRVSPPLQVTVVKPVPGAPLESVWSVDAKGPDANGVSQPILIVRGEVTDTNVAAVRIAWGLTVDGPWTEVYEGAPLTKALEIGNLTPGVEHFVAITHLSAQGVPSQFLVIGPRVPGQLVAGDATHLGGRTREQILTDVDAVKAGLGAVVEEVSDVREVAVTNAAAGAMNANPTFSSSWENEGPNEQRIPPGYSDWQAGWMNVCDEPMVGANSLTFNDVPENTDRGLVQDFRTSPQMDSFGPGWWVLEATAELKAGSLRGAGLFLAGRRQEWSDSFWDAKLNFSDDPDSTGSVRQDGEPGRTYRWSKLVRVPDDHPTRRASLWTMANWAGFGSGANAKSIRIGEARLRPATVAEIETGQARGSYPTMSARLSSEFTAIAGEQGVMALRQDRLEARAGTNEFNNADFSQGLAGYRHMWGGADGRPISTDVINRSEFIYGVKTGGANYDGTDYVVFGSIELGGGSFALPGQNYERAFKVFEGDRIGFAFDSRPSGGTASFWVPVIRFYDNAGNFTGHWTAFGGNPYATDWERTGGVFDVPVDGYAAIEAYLRLKGTDVNATGDAHMRRVTWARLPTGATQLPAYSAPAGGGQLAKVEETAGAVRTLEGKTKAWAERTVSAGSAEAFVQMKAEDDNGNPVSEINLGAQAIGLWTKVGSLFVPVFRLVGTSAHFAGKVFVGLLKQIAIDPDLPAIIWTKGNARIVIGMLPNDDMIYWFGPNIDPSAMRKSNATEWRDANGAAYYKGGISAGQLQASARTSDQSATVSAQTGRFGSLGGTITVVFSYAAETRVASTSYSPPFPPSYEDVSNDPTAQIRLYRSLNGGAFELVATFAATGQRRSWGINGGDYFEEGQEVVCGGAATFVDPDRNTLDRQYRAEMSGRSFTWLNGAGNYRSQFLNVVCVED
jgi:predicted phage tail protein